MNRLPIRIRLTAAFALAMIVVLATAGLFVYLRMRTGLEDTINAGLRARVDGLAALVRKSELEPEATNALPATGPEESFVQLLTPEGQVLQVTPGVHGSVLTPAELERATREAVRIERHIPGITGQARVLARPVILREGSPIVAVGQSLDARDEELSSLVASFAVGGPVAVVLASLLGYLLAIAALSPVEAMRRRASQVSLGTTGQALPLPAAHDEIRRLGETLNDMLDRLRRSFERERRFVADASHELRTPVAVVKTELEGALRTGDYGPQVREALVASVEECDHLAQLAEDLLVIARAGDGKLPVRAERLPVRPLLEGIRERFSDRAAQHGRAIVVDAPEDLEIRADLLRIRQGLGNLIDNALRHGDGEIAVTAEASGGGVAFEVADEGPGFPPDLADTAFERFTRGDRARTRGGAGLGLAIVRAVAEAHGGTVGIVPGRGATVRLWLPSRAADRGTPQPHLI